MMVRSTFSPLMLVFVLVSIKGCYLLSFGPVADAPDLPHYVTYASLILGNDPWISDAGLDEYMRQASLFRMIGYPALIALARLLTEQHWVWIIVVAQIALSIYSSWWIHRLGIVISGRQWVGFLAGLIFGIGLSLRFDQMVLTDSMAGSLLIVAFSMLAIATVEGRGIGRREALITGMLIVLAFLLRDTVRAIAFFYVPLTLVAVWRIRPIPGAVIRAALVFAPFLATMVAYQSWNEMRTGERFITTIPHSGYLISMMNATVAGAPIFAEDTPLDRIAREEFNRFDFLPVLLVVRRLQLEHGMTEPQVMWVVADKYKKTWIDHPIPMLKEFFSQFSPKHMLYVVSPLFSDLDLRTRTRGQYDRPSSAGEMARLLTAEGTIGAYLLLGLYALQAASSVGLTAVAYLYPLVLLGLAVRRRQMPDQRTLVLLSLWLFYWGMVALIALTWFEPRYTIPVMPILAVTGLAGIAHMIDALRRNKKGIVRP